MHPSLTPKPSSVGSPETCSVAVLNFFLFLFGLPFLTERTKFILTSIFSNYSQGALDERNLLLRDRGNRRRGQPRGDQQLGGGLHPRGDDDNDANDNNKKDNKEAAESADCQQETWGGR